MEQSLDKLINMLEEENVKETADFVGVDEIIFPKWEEYGK